MASAAARQSSLFLRGIDDCERTALGPEPRPRSSSLLLPWNWAATKAVGTAATGTPTAGCRDAAGTGRVPDFLLVRLAALFNKELRAAGGSAAPLERDFASPKARAALGWRSRPLEETVLDCARSLIATSSLR
jgi:hypothetical protein